MNKSTVKKYTSPFVFVNTSIHFARLLLRFRTYTTHLKLSALYNAVKGLNFRYGSLRNVLTFSEFMSSLINSMKVSTTNFQNLQVGCTHNTPGFIYKLIHVYR